MSKDTNHEKKANEIRKAFHFEPNQKFNYCISNPPYQKIVGTGTNADQAVPVYNIFWSLSLSLRKLP
jgi:tRNA1(Val) A37 N6-methylase TrmN6